MIQCKDCEFCEMGVDNRRVFKCDPFINIKEPECIAKWQLIRLDMLLVTYRSMQQWQEKIAPLQEREMGDIDESDKWKVDEEDKDEDNKDDKLL